MTFDAFDVVVVPFPFSDRNQQRRRPAVAKSSITVSVGQLECVTVVIIAKITCACRSPKDRFESTTAGLKVASVVRLKVFTLDADLLVRKIGALAVNDRHKLEATLRASLL